jgi:hypothetical protein
MWPNAKLANSLPKIQMDLKCPADNVRSDLRLPPLQRIVHIHIARLVESVMKPRDVKMIRRMRKDNASQPPVSGPNKPQHFTISRHASSRAAFCFTRITLMAP